MLSNDGYAVKKRKKPVQKIKPTSEVALSNPSKRHRDRLNGELERLTNLLPFPENVRCRLDKLSVLRLSVGYLKVKSFFNAAMQKNGAGSPAEHDMDTDWLNDPEFSEGELLLQSLNGFVLVVSAEGYVFYASPTIMDYLGFRQSDVIHQSVYELIHVDDRAIFCRQLHFALNPESFSGDQGEDDMQISSDITRNIVTYDPQHIPPENSSFLERSFVCRFRCLLDNSSGFLALNFQGRLKYLHGQQKRNADGTAAPPQLALFAVATPVQPPSILEIRTKTLIFQTKHKLDFTPLGIDTRGKVVLGYTEMELCMRGSGYQFIHAADMMYCADNHIRMMKTGESGLTVFRLLSKTGEWIWVQANAKLVYKGGKPDFIIARQRALANEEGEEHLRQRKLQLPFSFTTGEAVLYETNPSPDVTDFQHNDKVPTPGKDLAQNALDPDSLLGCMLKQDKSVYLNEAEPQLCADNVFMDTQALLSVPSDSWQEETPKAVDVKEESAVVAMIDTLEQMAQNRDLYTALQKLDVDSVELKEWENALLRLTREASGSEKALSLDDILTNDIISCVEDILLKDSNKCHVAPPKPSNGMKDPLAGLPTEFPANQLIPDFGLSGGQNFDCKSPAVNGLNQQELGLGSVGTPGQAVTGAPNIARGTERLSRPEHSSSGLNVPSLQQLQLKDILPPSLEIPDTSDLNGSCQNGNFSFGPSMIGSCTQAQSRNQVSMATPSASSFIQSNSYGIYHQKKMQDHPSCGNHLIMLENEDSQQSESTAGILLFSVEPESTS
ncbi:aryl hydrocarbon receptor-like [Chanos chanos]|uniref:Aryl hydrocarbon receptor-like n=1 Tax=Chanos chanos TaxID=29144 RepID=A0A6J2WDU8_CHACN|nr:aryl hydrocarbon receptor-like [Chanos chanos]